MPFKNPHPLYSVWQGMLRRCDNPNFKQFADYGGRGISVCPQWKRDFAAFVSDMGPRPAGHMIDRIDNDGNYTPENCRWATRAESQSNRRITQWIERDGVRYLLAALAKETGLKPDTIKARAAKGLTLAEIKSPQRTWNLAGLALGGRASGEARHRQETCPAGHRLTDRNTFYDKGNWRRCIRCRDAKG